MVFTPSTGFCVGTSGKMRTQTYTKRLEGMDQGRSKGWCDNNVIGGRKPNKCNWSCTMQASVCHCHPQGHAAHFLFTLLRPFAVLTLYQVSLVHSSLHEDKNQGLEQPSTRKKQELHLSSKSQAHLLCSTTLITKRGILRNLVELY